MTQGTIKEIMDEMFEEGFLCGSSDAHEIYMARQRRLDEARERKIHGGPKNRMSWENRCYGPYSNP